MFTRKGLFGKQGRDPDVASPFEDVDSKRSPPLPPKPPSASHASDTGNYRSNSPTGATTLNVNVSTPLVINTTARNTTHETFISDISAYDADAQYVSPVKDSIDEDDDSENRHGDAEKGGKFIGPEIWEEEVEVELSSEAKRLVRSYLKSMDEEDALLRQMAAAAAASDENPKDPLGMGTIDPKTLALVSQNSLQETSAAHLRRTLTSTLTTTVSLGKRMSLKPKVQKQESEKILPSNPDFSPELYLAKIHENTSLQDLQRGMQSLETELSKRTGQLKKLVKENFERFISCKNTLDDVYRRLQQCESDKRGVNTNVLRESITQVQEDVERAFAPLLDRNHKVVQIKNVMGVLRRFQSSFSLPSRIRQLAESQEYQQVVSEFKKSKAMLAGSDIATWHSLFVEVEKGVCEVANSIVERLEDPYLRSDAVAELVTHLLQLQNEGLPAAQGVEPVGLWLAAVEHHVHDYISMTTKQHQTQLASLLVQQKKKERSMRDTVSSSLEEVGKSLSSGLSDAAQSCWSDYISHLCDALLEFVPNLWAVRNSTQLKEVPDVTPGVQESVTSSLGMAERVIKGIIDAFGGRVMEAVDALLAMQGLIPQAGFAILKELRRLSSELMSQDGPPFSISAVQSFLQEVHDTFNTHLCAHLRQQMASLGELEDWNTLLGGRRGGVAVTRVPFKLGNAVREAMEQFKVLRYEQEQYPSTPRRMSRSAIRTSYIECFESFATAVEVLAANAAGNVDAESDATKGSDQNPGAARLLILMGNCRYIRQRLLNELSSTYEDLLELSGDSDALEGSDALISLENNFQNLEGNLIKAYVDSMRSRLDKEFEKSLEKDRKCPPKPYTIVGIGDGPVEWLHTVIMIQAEVYEFAPCKIRAILDPVILHMVNQVQKRTQDIPHLGYLLQMYIDTSFLEASLRKFQSGDLDRAWDSAYEMLVEKIMSSLADGHADLDEVSSEISQVLMVEGGAVEVDRKLQALCRNVLKEMMQRMDTNVASLGMQG